MSDQTEIGEEIAKLTTTAKDLAEQMKVAAGEDESRYNELKAQLDKVTEDFKRLKEQEAKAAREAYATARLSQLEADLSAIRSPSKASIIGPGTSPSQKGSDEFFKTLATATNPRLTGHNFDAMREAKATLESMGSYWGEVPAESKATVGDTDAAGGYLVPNNVVLSIDEQATAMRTVVDLATQINGVNGSAVDIPYEADAIARAVIAAPGATKENSNFAVNNYTATLYTLARIFDVGNQLLRQSAGAAESLVRSKLARAFALGEDYYFLNGTGSSQPYGLLTALGTSGAHVTTFSSPSNSTVAGSMISAVLTASGELADLGAVPDGAVLNSGDYYLMARQGSDTAGFWVDPFQTIQAAGADARGPGGLRWRHSPNVPTDTIVVGEFRDLLFVRGQGYRVDTSSEAGDRWDKNLTGFRGEEEIAFDARPSVYTLHFKRIVNAKA
jgi:HK97 family phage major capsid protein